jgi:CheY-like chemotaxis protein
MRTPPHILSVGSDPTLMSSRTLVLRKAGYLVDEAYAMREAIRLVEADSIDVMLICHTLAKEDQQFLISTTRQKRRLMPILCLRSNTYQSVPQTCNAVDCDPEGLLNALGRATKPTPATQLRNQRGSTRSDASG